jgi:hypothetical protein
MSAKKFVDPFPTPTPVPLSLGETQAAAQSKAPAQPTLAPARRKIDPHAHPEQTWCHIVYEEEPAAFSATVDSIVLRGDAFAVATRLNSGTIRTDRRAVTPVETEEMARDKRRREQNNYDEKAGA